MRLNQGHRDLRAVAPYPRECMLAVSLIVMPFADGLPSFFIIFIIIELGEGAVAICINAFLPNPAWFPMVISGTAMGSLPLWCVWVLSTVNGGADGFRLLLLAAGRVKHGPVGGISFHPLPTWCALSREQGSRETHRDKHSVATRVPLLQQQEIGEEDNFYWQPRADVHVHRHPGDLFRMDLYLR